MDRAYKLKYVKENFLSDAIASIKIHRRYWNSTISRTMTRALADALEEIGYAVHVWEIPPQWEHVFYLQEDAGVQDKEIKAIAMERFRLMEQGTEDSQLPR